MATGDELKDDQIRLVSILDAGFGLNDLHVSRKTLTKLPTTETKKSSATEERTTSVSPSTPYIAISYVWGQDRSRISCDDIELEVSSHLIPALRQLHQHYPHALFWTDSISIDQQNNGEKAHQVGMMGQIFAAAHTVVVWLGEGSEPIYHGLRNPDFRTKADATMSQARIRLLKQLAANPWFYRAWTFQEIRVATAAVVMLGTEVIPWNDFIDSVAKVRALEPKLSTVEIRSQPQSYSGFTYEPKDQFFSVLGELQSTSRSDLPGLLYTTWYRQATVKHDKVYALLSSALLSSSRHMINIDYDVVWSTLCVKTARACLNHSRNLLTLRIAGMKRRWKSSTTNRWDTYELNDLLRHPSWAPDWYEPPQQMRSISSFAYDQRDCFAPLEFCCSTTCPEQTLNNITPFLVLKGVVLGIVNVGDPPSWAGGPTFVHAPPYCAAGQPCEWLKNPDALTGSQCSLNGIEKVFMPRFVEEVHSHLHSNCSCVPFHERSGYFTEHSLSSLPAHNPSAREQKHLRFNHEYFTINYINTAAKMDKNAVGESEVPAQVMATSVESGDWLVLLEGGGVPFILRPVLDHMNRAQSPHALMTSNERKSVTIPDDAGCFILVGEASMCWDQLWPGKWEQYCKAGNFVIL